jgi:hypothetical protein
MIFVVPVAFMHLPALLVMVIVRIAPVGASVRRALPDTMHPHVMSSTVAPIAVGPDVSLTRHRRTHLVSQRWRRAANVHMDLGDGGCSECGKDNSACEQVQFPVRAYIQGRSPFRFYSIGCKPLMHRDLFHRAPHPGYFFNKGSTNGITFRATTWFPFAVACVSSRCIIPGTPYTSFSRNGNMGT